MPEKIPVHLRYISPKDGDKKYLLPRTKSEIVEESIEKQFISSDLKNKANEIYETGLRVSGSLTDFNKTIPIVAGKAIKVNADGTAFEVFDPAEGGGGTATVDPEKVMSLDSTNTYWDGKNHPIKNISQPTSANDVATKAYVDAKTQTVNVSDGKHIYCDTYQDINETLNAVPGQVIYTSGYYNLNDGGGATYDVKWIPDADVSTYPWIKLIGECEELEYQIQYRADGTPLTDGQGNYVYVEDANGDPVPIMQGGQPKHKKVYACINNKVINYRMFGAHLDGVEEDDDALQNAHLYQRMSYTIEKESERRRYYVSVENHEGIIQKASNEPIVCCGNIDLSGSRLVLKDANATWFGFYLWGDNESDYMTYEPIEETKNTYKKDNFVVKTKGNEGDIRQNGIIFLKEDPYAVRDDGGYLYSEPRYELLVHTCDGMLAQPFTEDWDRAGGMQISAPFSDYSSHQVTTDTLVSHFTINYTRMPATHYYFKGCEVKLNTTANVYCSVLWCKCHNAHISGFTFYPDSAQMHNGRFKNTMIYIWGSYNVEVSDIVGFNAAGKKEGGANATSGYVVRATNCNNLKLHDMAVQGYWGATAMNCVKDVHITRVSINRLDIHNYFYNLYIDECNLYNHSIQIGEGRGICRITNSTFYYNDIPNDSWPNAHLLEFNLTYGRIFEGKVYIENCVAFLKDPEQNEYDVCKIEFSPEACSILNHYKFPEVTIRDCYLHSYNENTYLVYFMIAGKRNCKTSTVPPANITNYCRDTGNDNTGHLFWKYLGRGVDWIDNGDDVRLNVVPGQIVRTYDKFLDIEGKTVFYNFKYFIVTQAGVLPTPTESNKPNNTSGNPFSLGTAKVKYTETNKWEATHQYAVGDFAFTEQSSWLPVFCYECVEAGMSNGWRPTHTSGTVIEGEDIYPKNLDACYWKYIGPVTTFAAATTFTPNMHVENNTFVYLAGRIYKVINSGNLGTIPPLNTAWRGAFQENTARLSFMGKDWSPITWWARDCYCVTTVNGVKTVYQLVNQDGTTSGDVPVPGNACSVDGDIIWEYTEVPATKQWAAQTQFFEGDIVSANGHNYKCIFDGRLELPYQINIENVSTNMINGDLFAFWEAGTDVPTTLKGKTNWKINVKDVNVYRPRNVTTYFCHTGNANPIITSGATGSGGAVSQPGKSAYEYAVDGGYAGTEEQFATALNNALSLANGNEVSY